MPGEHSIEFLHRCYEPLQFKVNVLSGKTTTVNNTLDATMGQFSLTTLYKGVIREVPVYVNGVMIGRTPLQARIPICAKVEVGEAGFQETVVIEWNNKEKQEVVYRLKNAKPTAEELRADSIAASERLAEQIAADEAARAAAEKEKRTAIMKTTSVAMFVLGIAGLGVGIYENIVVDDERKKYEEATYKNAKAFDDQWNKIRTARTTRNIFYGVGAGLIGVGTVLYIVF